jgi:hypothetical protein
MQFAVQEIQYSRTLSWVSCCFGHCSVLCLTCFWVLTPCRIWLITTFSEVHKCNLCLYHQGWSEEGQEVAGLYQDQVTGQSEPGMKKGEMQPYPSQWEWALYGAEGILWQDREKREILACLGNQLEGMDDWHGMWQDPVLSGVDENEREG